jgi:hypothetical protein
MKKFFLYEFGQVDIAKSFWDVLEMKYSKRVSDISHSHDFVEHSREIEST